MKYVNIQDKQFEMYNLKVDPSEKNNIIDVQQELAKELHKNLQLVLKNGLVNFSEDRHEN